MFTNIRCPKCTNLIAPARADTTYRTKDVKKLMTYELHGVTAVEYHCPKCNTLVVIPYETTSKVMCGSHVPAKGLVNRQYEV